MTNPADINSDGKIDSADIFAWVRKRVDVNQDGQINQSDAIAIIEAMNPVADDGWTKLTKSPDTLTIYVSADGNDQNEGTSPGQSLRTIAAGRAKLRNGKPDWLLIRRGDGFEGSFDGFNKSGRSENEPMVIATYGDGGSWNWDQRPVILTPGPAIGMVGDRKTRKHLAFVGLHFEPQQRGQHQGYRATAVTTRDILIEDCYFANYKAGISLDVAANNGTMSDIRIRRNVIVDNHNSSHAQGIFADEVDGLLIEGNIFDRNGWDHRIGRSDATIFAHNCYIQRSCRNVVFRDNISTRASSHGAQIRPGGIATGNVFIENPIGLLFANASRTQPGNDQASFNLVAHGIALSSDEARGWGLHLQDIQQVTAEGNIIVNSDVSTTGWGLGLTGRSDDFINNTTIRGNVVHDYGTAVQINPDLCRSVSMVDNAFSQTINGELLIEFRNPGIGGVEFGGNSYRGPGTPIVKDGSRQSVEQFIAETDPQGSTFSGFVNQNATIDGYAQSIGIANREDFYGALRLQRRGNWREDLTAEAIRRYFASAFQTV